jgi:hypothetical protein
MPVSDPSPTVPGFLPSGYKTSTRRTEHLDEHGERVEAVNVEHWDGRVDLELRPPTVRGRLVVPGRVVRRDMTLAPAPIRGAAGLNDPYRTAAGTHLVEIPYDQASELLGRIREGK